ncbi:hypothetical protein LCGC14_3014650 [marine sediment metagenome]|uniref:Uncharacterized protein n=1 Tax=marine sediment metagenome TaxID=412755 RepID=A0A0F8XK19_9ZZZZ
MTRAELQAKAFKLGLQDARQGRVYRHSADLGSWLRDYLIDYDKGWVAGRGGE